MIDYDLYKTEKIATVYSTETKHVTYFAACLVFTFGQLT